jgi:hypothetical protein
VRLGAYVSAGTHLTSLVPPQHWILTKLPVALSGEIALNSTPVAGEILCTLPWKVSPISVRLGAYVSAGTHLTSLVPPQHWVIANLKETQREIALNSTPVAGEILCTLPWKVSPLSASTVKVTGWTQIIAPTGGQLGQISVRLGAYVSAGTHLTSLVPPQRTPPRSPGRYSAPCRGRSRR